MITYIIIGFIFMGIVDLLHYLYLDMNPKYNLGWKERILCVLIWPWGLYILIKSLWSSYDRDN